MLEGGPIVDYFKNLASDEKNTMIFVSYQIEGTLGRRIQKGLTEVTIVNGEDKLEVVKIKLQIESIAGFSGHSDRRQIISYIRRLKPKPERIFFCHGERTKILNIANYVNKKFGIQTLVPTVMETFRLS